MESPESRPKGKLASFFHRNLGLFLIASAQLFFSLMNLSAKLLSMDNPELHTFEIIVVRMSITWLSSIAYLHYHKVPDYFLGPKGVRLLLVVRGVVGFFGLFGVYYSLKYLDLSDATVLTFLSPILTGYFGRIFLKEPFLRTELYAGLISLLGVVFIARPQSLFGSGSSGLADATNLQRLTAIGVALMGVLGAAGAYISIRAIGNRAHPLISVSMFSMYATCVAAIGMVILRRPIVFPHTILGYVEWTVIGISGFIAQLLLTAGLQRERAGRGITMLYLQMVFAFAWERMVWGIIPDFWSISGSGLILGGAIWVAVAKAKLQGDFPDDLERNEYVAVESEDPVAKATDFELGELSDDEEEGVGSSSASPKSPSIIEEEEIKDGKSSMSLEAEPESSDAITEIRSNTESA